MLYLEMDDSLLLFCFSWNPYLKTDGANHPILFSVKDPKQQDSLKVHVRLLHNLEHQFLLDFAFCTSIMKQEVKFVFSNSRPKVRYSSN